ncbi:adenylate/guanylate cyclase domain-containing protein [Epibacterium sp. MM17-32]|jgi:adenylate cyclase|uniref:adenylate/guanylate cyclase domain-containing protein n=1 Tax=Epibacterium sp. MM17-32 TaxID=2917734 RepID=UPI001EF582BA|nr:adenylate/guanylate cyclase domain-containing protein [Epibacterium sp. MM17-32]MCG7629775.1 adenylate/guanylate cyclase domain-containing protein [Epibacterium sp. MM17-32]
MVEATTTAPVAPARVSTDPILQDDALETKHIREALEEHKRRGVEMAVLARWIIMPIVAVFLIAVYPHLSQLYYIALLGLLCVNGYFIRRFARVGRSRAEVALIMFDLVLMTYGMVFPNPFDQQDMPIPMLYQYDNFMYFFIILAAGTLAYSWRTVLGIGVWASVIWLGGSGLMWYLMTPNLEMAQRLNDALADWPHMIALFDPNDVGFRFRIQEAMVFLMVAAILAQSTRRFYLMLDRNADLARERANLSRYFSPNVVEQLSQNDEPLNQVRTSKIAVLFIDIVGFTRLAAEKDAVEVIELLRGFHGRMEQEVFRHGGTLDKYLGDGLMATFGTPMPGDHDAAQALACARSMCQVLEAWNAERKQAGEAEIRAGIGIHFGETVQGDIGANRLEYAVIGTAVNVASRLEAMTRNLSARIAMSDDLCQQVQREGGGAELLDGFICHPDQSIRGLDGPMSVWTLPRPE